ncbi:hypothetical protein CP967_33760 [Streptomyces nitrosporeus]|uniref:Uncharacterized protein n=1 Tax=Streptomyces nitrosporeus TaxID=28894 RepID=A0A5J6FN43_9ACTN|nr:hypothetical protein CP967_33760 [Streptomyces nitrosporeus]
MEAVEPDDLRSLHENGSFRRGLLLGGGGLLTTKLYTGRVCSLPGSACGSRRVPGAHGLRDAGRR